MNKSEIEFFIEEMGAIGDEWTESMVESVYGEYTLEDALADRKTVVNKFFEGFMAILQDSKNE
jgi:hypothetical protein